MTFRRLRVLVDNLPPESATKTALRDAMTPAQWSDLPEPSGWGPWSRTDLLIAALRDDVRHMNWSLIAQQADKGKAGKPPEPLPRPGVGLPPSSKAVGSTDQIMRLARLKAIQAAHGGTPTEDQIQAALDELIGGDDG